jgi:RNA polymerase sigma-70 factor (ECF subfamily)
MNPKILQAVEAVQKGNQRAFETLYNEFSQLSYFTALKLLNNNQHEAEDVVQEVFIKVFQKIGELQDPQAFPAWLRRITVNQCAAVLKKSKPTISTEEVEELDFIEETDDALIPDKALDNAETARLIVEIIDKLPEPQRVCILFYYYEQMWYGQSNMYAPPMQYPTPQMYYAPSSMYPPQQFPQPVPQWYNPNGF